MVNFCGDLKEQGQRKFILSFILTSSMEPDMFAVDLLNKACMSHPSLYYVKAVKSLDGKNSRLHPFVSAKTWNVSVDIACRTSIQHTSRLCPRNKTIILLNRRYESNDCTHVSKSLQLILVGVHLTIWNQT